LHDGQGPGAAQSDDAVRQGSLARVAGREALAAADEVRVQLEACEIAETQRARRMRSTRFPPSASFSELVTTFQV
jgi:hypothetical protein